MIQISNSVRILCAVAALVLLMPDGERAFGQLPSLEQQTVRQKKFKPQQVDQFFRHSGGDSFELFRDSITNRGSGLFSLQPPKAQSWPASPDASGKVSPAAFESSDDRRDAGDWPAIWINGSQVVPRSSDSPATTRPGPLVTPIQVRDHDEQIRVPPSEGPPGSFIDHSGTRQQAVVVDVQSAAAVMEAVSSESEDGESPDGQTTEVRTAELIPEPISLNTPLDPATIREWKDAAESASLPDDVLATVFRHYDRAARYLASADESALKAASFQARLKSLPAQLAEVKRKLESSTIASDVASLSGGTSADLEAELREHETALNDAARLLAEKEAAAIRRKDRRPTMPSVIAAAETELAETRAAAESPAPPGLHPESSKARRVEQIALVRLREAALAEYRAEHEWYSIASEFLSLERTWASRSHQQLEEQLQALHSALTESRRAESQQQAAEARRMLQDAHPALRAIAERNAELTRTRTEFQDQMKRIEDDLAEVTQALNTVEGYYSGAKDKEKRAGLTTAVGMLLRNHRKHLTAYSRFDRRRGFAEVQIARLQVDQMALEDERDAVGDIASRSAALSEELVKVPNPAGIDLNEMGHSLLEDQQTYLKDLLHDYDDCLENLAELDVTSKKLHDTVDEFRGYIDERVLWIRSADPVNVATFSDGVNAAREFASIGKAQGVIECMAFEAGHYPYATAMALIAFIILLGLRSRFVRTMNGLANQNTRPRLPSVLATLTAIGLTLLIASVWPGIIWLIGWRLSSSMVASDFAASTGHALAAMAAVFWSIECFRQICRPAGVGERHLDWPASAMGGIHANLVGLMTLGLPIVFLFALADRFSEGVWSDSLGRFAFIAGMPLLAFTLHRIVNPTGPILRDVLEQNRNGWMFRLRHVWHGAVVGAPIVLGIMVFAGYQYTASELLIRLVLTFWLAILLLVGFSLAARAIAQAQREFVRVQKSGVLRFGRNGGRKQNAVDAEAIDPEQAAQKMTLMRQQIDRLARAVACVVFLFGCWTIWSQVLPAFQILDRIELWQVTIEVAEEVEVGDTTETQMVSKPLPITPGRLIVAAACLAFAIIAGRNIPALLELAVLQRLPIDAGGRNAISTLCRYGITIAGIIMACKAVGIGWSSVQWLVAALTVGLGFGLQEIFANFVSGLIILFERPIRIGDVVTIDGVTGSVARIQIRATTIIDLDQREYIVPNKEFVTGRVLNWTLSDETLRIIIKVGVAYGSDVEKCQQLMLQVAREHTLVMSDPPAIASFDGFGDSSLDLALRCYIPDLHERVDVVSELHAGINRVFEKEGITIPFPQMDLHVRSNDTLAQLKDSAPDIQRRAA